MESKHLVVNDCGMSNECGLNVVKYTLKNPNLSLPMFQTTLEFQILVPTTLDFVLVFVLVSVVFVVVSVVVFVVVGQQIRQHWALVPKIPEHQ